MLFPKERRKDIHCEEGRKNEKRRKRGRSRQQRSQVLTPRYLSNFSVLPSRVLKESRRRKKGGEGIKVGSCHRHHELSRHVEKRKGYWGRKMEIEGSNRMVGRGPTIIVNKTLKFDSY